MSKAKANRKQQLKGNRAHEGRRKKNFNIALIILRKKVMHLVQGALKKELAENQTDFRN